MSYKISFCTQIVLKRQKNIPQTQYFQGLRDFFNSLQLYGAGGLPRKIEKAPSDALHLVGDTGHGGLKDLEGDL